MTQELIGQALSIIAPILTVISYQFNSKKSVLLFLSGATLATAIAYFLLGATTGAVLNIICLLRNLVCYFFVKGKTSIYLTFAVCAIAMGAFGAVTWQGYVSLLIILGLVINSYFVILGDPQKLRYSILLTSTLVIIYNIIIFSIGGIANEALAIISSIIGIIRFRKEIKN